MLGIFDRHRACLTTIYSCGLRVGEGTRLHIGDIDGQRMLVHVKAAGPEVLKYMATLHLSRCHQQ